MASAAKRPCNQRGCTELVDKGYCQTHKRKRSRDDRRLSSTQRGYTNQWRKARLLYLKTNPLCVGCDAKGATTLANVVDHIEPHKQDDKLFWDQDNWQALCNKCHNTKTASKDGGFGNAVSGRTRGA